MRIHYYIALLILIVLSCKKQNLEIELTTHFERKIVGEGYFTDSLKKHQFRFSLSTDFGDTSVTYVNNIDLVVKTPEGDRNFSNIGIGLYESDEAFKGIYGENYTFQFTYGGILHEVTTKMPQKIEVNEIYYQEFDASNGFSGLGEIGLNISSPVDQYLRFSLYKGDYQGLGFDTVWTEVPLPVYRIAKINAGDSLIVQLPIEPYDDFYLHHTSLIKIKTWTISADVGDYLLRLKNYVQNELINNQSYNAPYYYSNEGYGLGFGTILDSAIHQF